MTALSPALDAALSADRPLVFGALRIDLPSYTLRLLDGAGSLTFDGGTFVGRDSTYGVLAAIDEISDGYGDEAPGLQITLHPASGAAAADLANPEMQGSRVRLWLGAADRATGAVVADPYLIFVGELDVPTIRVGMNSRVLEYECVSGFERFFDNDEGSRLSDAFHKSVWPGETGLANMTGLPKMSYWGAESPPRSITYSSGYPPGLAGWAAENLF